jgi:NADH:ubiquinone oxidoreductase subunit 5 (subunit L)/multisubunit Na+/H+ antiporter MnhA subunit
MLKQQYGLDWLYNHIIVSGAYAFAKACQHIGEQRIINRAVEIGIAHTIMHTAEQSSRQQTSLLNRYFAIMIGALICVIGVALTYTGIVLRVL